MNIRQISLGTLTKATGCVMSNPKFLAPSPYRPTRHTESSRDVLLKNTVGFQLAEKLMVWTAIGTTGDSVSLAPTVDRASANAKDCGDCCSRFLGQGIRKSLLIHFLFIWCKKILRRAHAPLFTDTRRDASFHRTPISHPPQSFAPAAFHGHT